jgi:hypothetical protein
MPDIPIGYGDPNYWKLSYEERRAIREAYESKQQAYAQTLIGRLDHWFWCFRGWLSDKIAPEGWNE